jgi:DNA processing protein
VLDAAELDARLTLRAIPGLRDRAINRLIHEHGSAAATLCAPSQLLSVGAQCLPDAHVMKRVSSAQRVIDELDVRVLYPSHADYPARLKKRLRSSCPSLLFVMGDVQLLNDVSIAVVGSRGMTEYGRTVAEEFSRDLALAGLTVVSGLALGIDAAAHTAALDAAGDTIAVVGNGIDITYPRQNARLRERIIAHGALVSQFLPGDRPTKYNFPERNLIMASLAEGVLVVEAGERSGAIITAHHAGDFGVETMAVPGSIGRPMSMGTNQLIREGVACVTTVAEVLEEMGRPGHAEALAAQRSRRAKRIAGQQAGVRNAHATKTITAALRPEAQSIHDALAGGVRDLDEIATKTRLPISSLLSTLLHLELAGVIRQHPGSRYELRTITPAWAANTT